MGYQEVDVNGRFQTGFTYSHGTLRDGLRCSSSKAYLRRCHDRPNLHVSTYSFVEKIHFSSESTHGVEFRHEGRSYVVQANCEVILSAGSIQSPQLMMLSGIGPRDHLEEMGIPVVMDVPGVGQNLQDHVAMGGLSYLIDPPDCDTDECFSFVLPKLMTLATIKEFVKNKTGPLYVVPECEAMAFINTGYTPLFFFSSFVT